MRRWSRVVPVLAAACGTLAVEVPNVHAQAGAKPVVASVTEPPDTQSRGGKWRLTLTVANEGSRTAGAETVRFYLSRGRRFSSDDLQRRLSGDVDLPRIARNRQVTRRVTLRIPQSIQNGVYYLVTCLGRAKAAGRDRPGSDTLNCRFSGQTMEIGRSVTGQAQSQSPGAPGPAGPAGPQGPPGPSGDFRNIARTTLQVGDPTIDDGESDPSATADDGDETEGSTESTDLITVGPFTFRALCRNNQGYAPVDEDEAKILVYTNGGTMNFMGAMGPRFDIPAGMGEANDESHAGGEGKHQIIAADRDLDVMSDETLEGTDDEDSEGGFEAGSVVLTHSDGTLVTFTGYAGIDTLGVGSAGDALDGSGDECVFGGSVTVFG